MVPWRVDTAGGVMRVLPPQIPAIRAGRTGDALQGRWPGVRRSLLISMAMPVLVAMLCLGMLGAAATGPDVFPWLVTALWLGSLLPAAVYVWWLRGAGLTDPPDWPRLAFVVCGVQMLVGAIPCVGAATALASSAGRGVAGGLFVLTSVCGAVSVVAARRAVRRLTTPLVPDLGATGFRLAVGVRFAVTAPELLSARLEITTDHLLWTVRSHRGRGAGPQVRGVIPFGQLRQVVPIVLPGQPALHRWLTLQDGTTLYAQPGPALLLTTTTDQWMVPVHDAAVLAAIIDERRPR